MFLKLLFRTHDRSNQAVSPRGLLLRPFSLLLTLLTLVSVGCAPESRDRPDGYIRLGQVRALEVPESYIDRGGLLLRWGPQGFWVMSTLSTRDLTRLERRQTPEGWKWYSSTDESVFSDDGVVLHGPAIEPLPYYELTLDSAKYGEVKDTLYAKVGSKKPKNWRLLVELPKQ